MSSSRFAHPTRLALVMLFVLALTACGNLAAMPPTPTGDLSGFAAPLATPTPTGGLSGFAAPCPPYHP